jgi:hypothetical protein
MQTGRPSEMLDAHTAICKIDGYCLERGHGPIWLYAPVDLR